LNDEQRAAAEAVRGPVCILAGAGSGKTTTLTRRIANQIASAEFGASDVLALTFTDRAANELRTRLKRLGINGDVRARTFHAEASRRSPISAPRLSCFRARRRSSVRWCVAFRRRSSSRPRRT